MNADGKLGTTTSSRRFKEEIKPMERVQRSAICTQARYFPLQKKEIDPAGYHSLGWWPRT